MKYLKPVCVLILCFAGATCLSQNKPLSADAILKTAYGRAQKENKHVFVIFHASWCGWCRKMDSSMNDKCCKAFFDSNYITCHLTVDESKEKQDLENPGARKFRKKYHGEEAGLPFWLIFDQQGQLLADSKMRPADAGFEAPGDNAGCPSAKVELAYFIRVLEKTSRLGAGELAIIAKRFSQNAAQ